MTQSQASTTSWDSRETLTDLLVVVGLGLIFYGLYGVAQWLAFVVVGALLFSLGVFAAYIRAKPRGINAK